MSNETKWTPGPWTMETVRTSVGLCFRVGPFPWKNGKLNHACIYADYPSSVEHAIGEANARLIAQVPDMARVCELIDAHYSASLDHQPPYVALARAALAKARGHE